MKTKFFLLSGLLVSLLITTGCGVTKQDAAPQSVNIKDRDNFNTSTFANIPRTPGSVFDLTVGKKIMVVGTSNADGTINARQIMVGEINFGMNFRTGTRDNMPPSSTVRDSIQVGQNEQASGVQRPDRANMNQGGGSDFGGRTGAARMSSQTRINGEILKKDDTSLVLKLIDGGSKVVFYSDKTEIFILSTSTPAIINASTSLPIPPTPVTNN